MATIEPRRFATVEKRFIIASMANTFSQVYLHLVFSTKNRVDWISPEIEKRVWSYLAGIAKHHKMTPIQIGGIETHIHALLGTPTIVSPAQATQYLKGDSSRWIHNEFHDLAGFGGIL